MIENEIIDSLTIDHDYHSNDRDPGHTYSTSPRTHPPPFVVPALTIYILYTVTQLLLGLHGQRSKHLRTHTHVQSCS